MGHWCSEAFLDVQAAAINGFLREAARLRHIFLREAARLRHIGAREAHGLGAAAFGARRANATTDGPAIAEAGLPEVEGGAGIRRSNPSRRAQAPEAVAARDAHAGAPLCPGPL